jgi:hypothetical protein
MDKHLERNLGKNVSALDSPHTHTNYELGETHDSSRKEEFAGRSLALGPATLPLRVGRGLYTIQDQTTSIEVLHGPPSDDLLPFCGENFAERVQYALLPWFGVLVFLYELDDRVERVVEVLNRARSKRAALASVGRGAVGVGV